MGAINLVGKRVHNLTVVERVGNVGRQPAWQCKCDCGGEIRVLGVHLRAADTFDCGCGTTARRSAGRTEHGLRYDPIYGIWRGIIDRCTNPESPAWNGYGGRGITVCDRWLDVAVFASDMGARPSLKHSIDRIDNSKGYEPSNCRWATSKDQANNKRNNVLIVIDGVTRTMAQWSELFGCSYAAVKERKADGKTGIDLFTESPRRAYKRLISFDGKSMTVTDWANHLLTPYITVWQRINQANKNPDGSTKI